MANLVQTYNFTTPGEYTYDPALIEVSSGVAQLLLGNNAGQVFNEDFANDTGFTYDSAKTEFVAGVVRQKNLRPTDSTFYAEFGTDINGNWGDGVLTGTATGGANVAGGKLDLRGGTVKYVDYAGANNANTAINTGCIRFKVTPNYSGTPGGDRDFVCISRGVGDSRNIIQLRHRTTNGTIQVIIFDSAGVTLSIAETGVFSPVAGTEYEIELNYDLIAGATRLFVDGVQLGSNIAATGTRDSLIDLVRIGSNVSGINNADFEIDDFLLFDTVQHTSNYIPDWSVVGPVPFPGDVITLPSMVYPGIGNIQAFTNIISTETNTPRWIVNGQYYSGGWVASSDTWATASPLADILANIATLPVADTIVFKLVTQDSVSIQMSVDDLTLTYTGQAYPITNPTIVPTTSMDTDGLVSFTETASAVGLDAVRYALQIDGTNYYHNGSIWTASTGYAQTNTAAEITTQLNSLENLIEDGVTLCPVVYLHSETGLTAPSIDNLECEYSFVPVVVDTFTVCTVWANLVDFAGININDKRPIFVQLNKRSVTYKNYTVVDGAPRRILPKNGRFEMELLETENMSDGDDDNIYYIFTIKGTTYRKKVPAQTNANFWTLEEPTEINE